VKILRVIKPPIIFFIEIWELNIFSALKNAKSNGVIGDKQNDKNQPNFLIMILFLGILRFFMREASPEPKFTGSIHATLIHIKG